MMLIGPDVLPFSEVVLVRPPIRLSADKLRKTDQGSGVVAGLDKSIFTHLQCKKDAYRPTTTL